jgi:hypothetical protein
MEMGAEFNISYVLRRLNGKDEHSLLVWRMPSGMSLGDVNPQKFCNEFLQSAGNARRMCIEVRRKEGNRYVQYAVGRKNGQKVQWRSIKWASYNLRLHASEIFSAREATPIYEWYLRTGEVPSDLVLRLLELP